MQNKLFCGRLSLIHVNRIAEFFIQHVDVSVEPCFRDTVLDVFIYAPLSFMILFAEVAISPLF